MNTHNLIKHTGLAFTFILSSLILSKLLPNNYDLSTKYNKNNIASLGSFDIKTPNLKFGFVLDTFSTETIEVQEGESLITLLNKYTTTTTQAYNIIASCKKSFNPRIIHPGMQLTILRNKITNQPDFIAFEPDVYRYVVFDMNNPDNIKVVNKPVQTNTEVVSGTMEGSLWQTIKKYDMDTDLASQMEDAMECSMDLSRAGKGDVIKLVYEKNTIEGQEVDAGKLLAAYYKGRLGEKYVFFFDNGKYKGYFDQDGRPMKKSYLAAPLKYAKITSKFSLSRLHPILNKVIPHFGTDYAAPTGTPIIAVSDGIIEAMGYGSGNGNFVKIKHDNTYATQYLHMSRFPRGQKRGQKVKQGQVIGYVGSTGLATGPHVCFRFWKNGRQVNPKSCKLPAPNPIPGGNLSEFKSLRNDMLNKLAAIGKPIPGEGVIKKGEEELILLKP
ncbi:MAG: peptidoglycan DD-metalloendopeptidase family protein [Saprospiraceae bacterium]|uniref:M23 family metallopeptidase n=1 Tax=Candidatus Brachybacter algidus TaxID=2982024 RepID=UPI001B479BD5|nr:peptidoglycan DD-metalloendopeptidase family protein [Candidatus Brachybacter algidus]MBK7604027.1 peptidoglycan DD-metalloendopeptidase family protein [Candidatus Brachybacter algidus]MBK8746346.1 peptidoglycan DD-metalloendopeptidase family protein [Candidatus Brachybacter algidus]MBK9023445.1 peptidoglycan DD-metalloendopeptidase family protein [Candidatus Brachybacter algidus]MBP7305336.1 peptidoglycan DD-metalloendopeptidase family protein [Saprospiraceae bacterium]